MLDVQALAAWFRRHLEVTVVPLAALLLHTAGFDFEIGIGWFALLTGAVAAVTAWLYARWPDVHGGWRLHVRAGTQSLALMVLVYVTGWGAALVLVFVFVVADNVRYGGADVARPALDWSLAAIALGQLGVEAGVLPSGIERPGVHGVAAIGALGLAVVAQRIQLLTRRKEEAEAELSARETRFRALLEHSSDVIVVVDDAGTIRYQSPSSAALLGYDPDRLVGTRYAHLVHPADLDRLATEVAGMLRAPGSRTLVECRIRHADGHWVPVESNCTNLVDDPDIAGFVVNTRDVSDRKRLEAQLQHRAFHDGLTGLANRHLFRDRVDHVIARGQRHDEPFAVLFLDLDGFKDINDSLGHQAGDRLLVTVAERLRGVIRDLDTAARLGGDEFAVLVEDLDHPSDAARVAERILAALREPVDLEGTPVTIDGSIGIAVSDADSHRREAHLHSPTDAVLRNADIAMYMAKSAGKGRYEVFEPAMHLAVVERLRLESDLQRALEDGQLRLHYQPIVDLADQTTVGVEALLRWDHPERGLVSPGAFIPLAEETGLIVPIGAWVLTEACRQAAAWNRDLADRPALGVSVNVSPRQLVDDRLVDDVRGALRDAGLAPSLLTLEVTESALVHDVERSVALMRELKALGVRLAIDDFGTGYSSLAYLQSFPFDVLKIDRSFIDGLTSGSQSPAVVRAIVDIGRTLELDTVAEGIEHDEQLDRFRELHCNYGQGYLFARPQAAEDVFAVLAARPRVLALDPEER